MIIILGFFIFSCRTIPVPTSPIEPAKCGVACMDQDKLSLNAEKIDSNTLKIRINFTFLGENTSNNNTIDKEITALNLAFGTNFIFELGDVGSKLNFRFTLNELYENYVDDAKLIQFTRDSFNQANVINVFVLKTIADSTNGNVLLGFTPIYTNAFDNYALASPDMDQIFISYQGLERITILIHELGHFFSLAHPWQLTLNQQKKSWFG